jgi:hypothetical protein
MRFSLYTSHDQFTFPSTFATHIEIYLFCRILNGCWVGWDKLERMMPMNLTEIRRRALDLGITGAARVKKGDLIRRIQRTEGNFDCYGSPGRFDCPQQACCWRESCLTNRPG